MKINDYVVYNDVDAQYLDLLEEVKENGIKKDDRTGVGTISSFGYFLKFDLSKGFPILTTKKVNFDIVKDEFIWFFIKGSTNINDLQESSRMIWKDWVDENGSLGNIYGKQARNWVSYHRYSRDTYTKLTKNINNYFEAITLENGFIKYEVDQIKRLIWLLKNDPNSRRMVLNLWNVGELPLMALPPCHYTSVFNVNDNKLNCHITLRSNDLFLGNPFNISSYALFTNLLAHCCNLEVGELALSIVDAHIYSNHIEQVDKQLSRYDKMKELPTLWLNPNKKDFFSFGLDDIKLIGYEHEGYISAPIAV